MVFEKQLAGLCAIALLRATGSPIQAAVLAKAQGRKGRKGRRVSQFVRGAGLGRARSHFRTLKMAPTTATVIKP